MINSTLNGGCWVVGLFASTARFDESSLLVPGESSPLISCPTFFINFHESWVPAERDR